jgi:hypothetical protein
MIVIYFSITESSKKHPLCNNLTNKIPVKILANNE